MIAPSMKEGKKRRGLLSLLWEHPVLTVVVGFVLVLTAGLVLPFLLPTHCIVEGTRVDTPDGARTVESLRVGDRVWTRAADGTREAGYVTAIRRARAVRHLEIRTTDGSLLRVTPVHPIATVEGWKEAGRLDPGDRVKGRDGWRHVSSVRRRTGWVAVYDLEVEPNSNFFAEGVLVHNKSPNDRNASAMLKCIATAEADFRSNDRDGNKVNDYWVADLQGLYSIADSMGEPLKLIEFGAALADAAPRHEAGGLKKAELKEKSAPKSGYWFSALTYFEDERGVKIAYDDGTGRNRSRFGFLTYPAEYGASGKWSFIVNEEGTIYRKDLKGRTIDTFPRDPKAEGWEKLD